jgi:CheY-like chemotaxis protein
MGVTKVILVVDDEAAVLRMVCALLEAKGYTVQSADNGHKAAELFQRQPESIALLLTDLAMPGTSGIELIHKLKTINPELPVVAMSGDLTEWQKELGSVPCIEKPFTVRTLLRSIEQHLKPARSISPVQPKLPPPR